MVNSTDEEEKKSFCYQYMQKLKNKKTNKIGGGINRDILFKMLRKTPSSLMNYFFSTVIDLCFFYNNYQ